MLAQLSQAHATIRILENQLEAEKIRSSRQRKRIERLEEETGLSRQALPAVETIIKSALSQFEAKESALKHTIAKLDQEYNAVLHEKNEAVRLLNTFVGRGRSPPPSFSSVSETGLPPGNTPNRRIITMDAFRRARTMGVLNDPNLNNTSLRSNRSSVVMSRRVE